LALTTTLLTKREGALSLGSPPFFQLRVNGESSKDENKKNKSPGKDSQRSNLMMTSSMSTKIKRHTTKNKRLQGEANVSKGDGDVNGFTTIGSPLW
jgi:hypothetical protein